MAEGHAGGAYARLDKTENYVGQALTNLGNVAFRDRQVKQQRADKIKEEKDAEYKSYGSPEFKAIATNNTSLNDLTSKQALLAQQKYLEFKDVAINTDDREKKAQAIQGMQKIKNSFDYSAQFPTMLNNIRAEIVKGRDNGSLDETSANEMLQSADQLNKGQANLRYDAGGNIKFDVYDKEGKITNENQTYESYLSSINALRKSTYNDDLLKYQQKYKVDEITTKDANGREVVDQRVNRTVGSKDYNNALEYAQSILSKENERKIIAREHNIDPNDAQKLQEFVTNDVLNSIQSKYSNKQDPNLALEREKEARRIREKANDDAKNELNRTLENPSEFKQDTYLIVDGVKTKMPTGTKNIAVKDYVSGDPKKDHKRINTFHVKKGSDGKVQIFGEVETIRTVNSTEKQTTLSDKGLKERKANKAKFPKATDEELNAMIDPLDVIDVTTSQKENPKTVINFGRNQAELAKYLPKGVDANKEIRTILKRAGINPDTASKGNKTIEKEKPTKAKKEIKGF